MSRRLRAYRSTLVLLLVVLASCAKKGPPTGGPPDIEPPRLIGSSPDSGAAGVARDAQISLTFSEGMEPRGTGDAISIAPRVEIRQRRWSGRTVTIVPGESLQKNQTYTVFLGNGARDRHGNALAGRATIVFTTADTLPRGTLDGRVIARGFAPLGTYVWCYDAATDRVPDSTARDFDAIGIADLEGRFRIVGLPVPGRYRLWVFADFNGNRSFEPATDVLAPADTVFALTGDHPGASGFAVTVVDPRAPGHVKGAVLDSLGITGGALAVVAVAAADSLNRVLGTVDDRGAFELQLPAGTWLVRAWRDLDRNRNWQRETEPASPPRRIEVKPADEITNVTLVLERRPAGP
jgi:hypothetical protein